MSFIDSIAGDSTINDDTVNGVDERIAAIESQLGYTSSRSILKAAWDAKNIEGWDINEVVTEDFPTISLSVRSVYNADRNLRVGNMINHLYSDDVAIMVKNADPQLVDMVNDLPAGLTRDELLQKFAGNDLIHVWSITTDSDPLTRGTSLWKPTGDENYATWFKIERTGEEACNNNVRKYKLREIKLSQLDVYDIDLVNSAGGSIDIQVDWGDGSPVQTANNVPISVYFNSGVHWIYWPAFPQEHTYPSGGTYTVKVKVKKPTQSRWVAEASQSFDIPQYLCSGFTKRKVGERYKFANETNPSWCVGGTLEAFQGTWTYLFKWEACTHAYKIEGTKKKSKKTNRICVQMTGNTFEQCTTPDYHAKAEWPFNDKSTSTSFSIMSLAASDWSVIYSNHQIWYNGNQNISLDLQLTRCD